MKKLLIAVAFGLALPAVAHAQEAPKMACCEKMKDGCECCKDEEGDASHDGHAQPSAPTQPHAH